ncbi:MAG TPA: DNRLRE domain-containing protein, partial [Rariglobus sp.]
KGAKSVLYSPSLAQGGDYDVYLRWPAKHTYASNTPVSVTSTAGTASFLADQESAHNLWNRLGSFPFSTGSTGNVLVENTGTTNYVIADAVMFVPRPVTSTITALADAYVRDGSSASTNYGPYNNLDVKMDATGYNRIAYLRFNAGGLSTASLVQLQLTPIKSSTTTTTFTLEFVSDDTWTETGITWNNQPAGSGTVLGHLTMTGLKVGVPVSIDITNQVRAEAAGDGKISVRIRADVSSNAGTYLGFASRTNATTAYRPKLLVQ